MIKKPQTTLKNAREVKLSLSAHKFGGMKGLFARVKASLPLNKAKKHGVRNFFLILGTCAALWVGYNTIKASILNAQVPVAGNNFEPGNVFQQNGNDVQFDNNGAIIEDNTTQQEQSLLQNEIVKQLRKDANRRCSEQIDKIDSIVSFSLLPYNDNAADNEFDKYMLAVLFNANGKTYTLTYLTGMDFSSDAVKQKGFLGDFVDYLKNECSSYYCEQMGSVGSKIAGILNATYVGDYYYGYVESGEEYYYIPVFQNGTASIYRASRNSIDGPQKEPMTALLEQLSSPNDKNQLFEKVDVSQVGEDMQKIVTMIKAATENEQQ